MAKPNPPKILRIQIEPYPSSAPELDVTLDEGVANGSLVLFPFQHSRHQILIKRRLGRGKGKFTMFA